MSFPALAIDRERQFRLFDGLAVDPQDVIAVSVVGDVATILLASGDSFAATAEAAHQLMSVLSGPSAERKSIADTDAT